MLVVVGTMLLVLGVALLWYARTAFTPPIFEPKDGSPNFYQRELQRLAPKWRVAGKWCLTLGVVLLLLSAALQLV